MKNKKRKKLRDKSTHKLAKDLLSQLSKYIDNLYPYDAASNKDYVSLCDIEEILENLVNRLQCE